METEKKKTLLFGPAFFFIVMGTTWVVISIHPVNSDGRAGMLFVPLMLWLIALVGSAVNVFRWRKYGKGNRIGVIILTAIGVIPLLLMLAANLLG